MHIYGANNGSITGLPGPCREQKVFGRRVIKPRLRHLRLGIRGLVLQIQNVAPFGTLDGLDG